MSIQWGLKEALQQKGIHSVGGLKKALREELGVEISRQALGDLLNHPPIYLKMQTAQYLCTLLGMSLDAFLRVSPAPMSEKPEQPIKPYGKKPPKETGIFTNPLDLWE